MAITYKILGQVNPTVTGTNVDAYTVPAGTQTIISTLTVTNVTASSANARVYLRQNGAAFSVANTILNDVAVAANSVAAFTLGLTLGAGDVVTVRSSTGTALTFQLFGSQIA